MGSLVRAQPGEPKWAGEKIHSPALFYFRRKPRVQGKARQPSHTALWFELPHFRKSRGEVETLSKVKGRFLLSSYPSKLLKEFIKKHKWKVRGIKKAIAVTKLTDKKKIELMVTNYDPEKAEPFLPKLLPVKEIEQQLNRLKFAA